MEYEKMREYANLFKDVPERILEPGDVLSRIYMLLDICEKHLSSVVTA